MPVRSPWERAECTGSRFCICGSWAASRCHLPTPRHWGRQPNQRRYRSADYRPWRWVDRPSRLSTWSRYTYRANSDTACLIARRSQLTGKLAESLCDPHHSVQNGTGARERHLAAALICRSSACHQDRLDQSTGQKRNKRMTNNRNPCDTLPNSVSAGNSC